MNRKQWIASAIIFFIASIYLASLALSWQRTCTGLIGIPTGEAGMYTACVIKAQSYFIPAFIFHILWWVFFICAWLEPKRR